MTCILKEAPSDVLAALQQEPRWIRPFLLEPAAVPGDEGLFLRLYRALRDIRLSKTPACITRSGLQGLDLDKSFHGLHFLLCGRAWEENAGDEALVRDKVEFFLMYGGADVGTVNVGYGPARMLTVDQVNQWHDWLVGLNEDALRSRFDPTKMSDEGVYPDIWDEPIEEVLDGYLLEHFRALRDFLSECVSRRSGVVIALQ